MQTFHRAQRSQHQLAASPQRFVLTIRGRRLVKMNL